MNAIWALIIAVTEEFSITVLPLLRLRFGKQDKGVVRLVIVLYQFKAEFFA